MARYEFQLATRGDDAQLRAILAATPMPGRIAVSFRRDPSFFDAAVVDGAGGWDIFRFITFPAILPVTSTLILIRMIEAFKIIDLPNIMTNGGPGTATESLTLHAYLIWRALDIGGSAAIGYILLFVVTFAGIAYVTLIRRRVEQNA